MEGLSDETGAGTAAPGNDSGGFHGPGTEPPSDQLAGEGKEGGEGHGSSCSPDLLLVSCVENTVSQIYPQFQCMSCLR